MNIVLFSDLHGHILLAYKLVKRLQEERNISIDLILQCGDMGIFPDLQKLDKATLRHAKNNPLELGFYHHFYKLNRVTEEVLSAVKAPMVCVRGNHEDHDFLDMLEENSHDNRFSVDYYKRIFICKSGELQQFDFNKTKLNVVGIGRIGDRKGRQSKAYIQDYERATINKTQKEKTPVNILITHDAALHAVTKDFGMKEIDTFINKKKPKLHFFGHTGTPYKQELTDNGVTTSIKIVELEFDDRQQLPNGSMVFLQWKNENSFELEVIQDSWLKEYQPTTWEYL